MTTIYLISQTKMSKLNGCYLCLPNKFEGEVKLSSVSTFHYKFNIFQFFGSLQDTTTTCHDILHDKTHIAGFVDSFDHLSCAVIFSLSAADNHGNIVVQCHAGCQWQGCVRYTTCQVKTGT